MEPIARLARPDDLPALAARDPWPRPEAWRRRVEAGEVVVLDAHGRGLSRRLLAFLCDHLRALGFAALLNSSQSDEPGPQAWGTPTSARTPTA